MQLLQQITLGVAILSLVTSAVALWRPALRSSSQLKRVRNLELTIADLQSNFDALMESHKRLRSRTGMRELREARGSGVQSVPAGDKSALRRALGLNVNPIDFVKRQQQLELERGKHGSV